MNNIFKNLTRYLVPLLFFFLILQICLPIKVFADDFEDVPGWPAIEDIEALAYSVYDATTDEFLLEHNIHAPLWNASTTKVLTALTAVKHEKFDLDAKLLVSQAATYFGDPASVRLHLKAGELISTRDVLGGLMVQSANDCAYVLAENYGGLFGYTSDLPPEEWGNFAENAAVNSREAFVAEMNSLAKSLGAEDTNFDNPCGWDGETHHTTAHDLTLLSKALLENEILSGFVNLAHYMAEPTNMHPYAGWSMVTNTNSLVVYGTNFFQSQYISHYNGVKTGATPLAGNCLIGSGVTHHGHQIIAVILAGSVHRPDDNSYVQMAFPVRTLLEYGAYLSGSNSKPYQEAALPGFPAVLTFDETVAEEEPNAGESTGSTESAPTESTVLTEMANTSDNPLSTSEKAGEERNPQGVDGITQREKLVIALCALIVACVVVILTGHILYTRKRAKSHDEK